MGEIQTEDERIRDMRGEDGGIDFISPTTNPCFLVPIPCRILIFSFYLYFTILFADKCVKRLLFFITSFYILVFALIILILLLSLSLYFSF